MKTNNEDLHLVPAHIEDDDLVGYLDGERGGELQIQLQSHLESCWYCRGRLSSVERSIENFLEMRHARLLPPEIPPAGPAIDQFRTRLASHKALTPSHAFYKQIAPNVRSLFDRIARTLNFNSFSLRTQIFATRALAAVVMTSLVVGFILMSGRYNTVSASELLRLSIEAQNERINQVDQPVLHQRIQVKAGNSDQPADIWEIWNDTVNARVRTKSGGERSAESSVIRDLRTILRVNHMNEHRALSAASYRSWSDSLQSKTEEVSKDVNSDGKSVLTLRTVPNDAVAPGMIASARFSVRESDYHPIALSIRAMTPVGEEDFELVEQDFQIVSLKNIDPFLFADPTNIEIASTVGTVPRQEHSPHQYDDVIAGTAANAANTGFPTATTADEVEVLYLLNKAGADVTEQLTVTRAADGRLLIEGLVESDKRKSEILAALSPVSNNPAIRIKIQTIEEATKALARQKQQANQTEPRTVERIEIGKGSLPVDNELRAFFASRGGNTDAEIRSYTSRVVNHSQSAAFQASALNRMAGRFTAAQLADLDPSARTKWIDILRGYAAAIRQETATLRGDLNRVFGGFDDGGGESIANDTDLIASSRRLYEMAEANDRIVRSAFTLSSGGASTIKTAQFRRSLASAESLAAAIEKAR